MKNGAMTVALLTLIAGVARAQDKNHLDGEQRAAVIEDIARNLAPAAALGMTTVWLRNDSPVGVEGADGDHVHHVIDDLVPWLEDVVADRTLS